LRGAADYGSLPARRGCGGKILSMMDWIRNTEAFSVRCT
jgi:hypothetical protein